MKVCIIQGCAERQHARSRCVEHWVALCAAECRSSVAARKPNRRLERVRAARAARLGGLPERHRYIMRHKVLPEDQLRHGIPRGSMALRNQVLERTFVSDIELDNGTGAWLGYEYFGDVARVNWPYLEKLGIGGRDTRFSRKRR
jgi:hypothetical protein